MTESATRFEPDWVSPPGNTITDLLEERGWSQQELAQRLGYSEKHVSQLINGKVPLTDDAAMRLNSTLGAPAGFWLTREAQYRERLARQQATARYAAWNDWLDKIPVRELMRLGKIDKRRIDARAKPAIVEQCLAFFGVASPDGWQKRYGGLQLQFRRSREDQCDLGAIAAWLRMGEQAAEKHDGPRYDETKFRAALEEMRALTGLPPEQFEARLMQLFHASGVIFELVPAIPRSHVSGVARWLDAGRPLIQLSLYGKTNDKFWFTLFHEAAHILLHGGGKTSRSRVYLDDPTRAAATNEREREANVWARDMLIPRDRASALAGLKSKSDVVTFARQLGIHPGIVVGRLQHDRLIEPSWMNKLKVSFRLVDGD
jgi:HTH-type transcriptional regulator/antitoxin HigA